MSPLENSPSTGWRETYRQMGVDPDGWDDDPLENLRDREEHLEAIAESDAPDAPVARIMLLLVRGEDISSADIDAIHREEPNHA